MCLICRDIQQEDVNGRHLIDAYIGIAYVEDVSAYVWVNGDPPIYDNWAADEPNFPVSGSSARVYGPPVQKYGTWDDIPGKNEHSIICGHELRALNGNRLNSIKFVLLYSFVLVQNRI